MNVVPKMMIPRGSYLIGMVEHTGVEPVTSTMRM